jgi:hypothetical protein
MLKHFHVQPFVLGHPLCVRTVRRQAKKLKPPRRCYLRRSCSKHCTQEPNIKAHFSPILVLFLGQIHEKSRNHHNTQEQIFLLVLLQWRAVLFVTLQTDLNALFARRLIPAFTAALSREC